MDVTSFSLLLYSWAAIFLAVGIRCWRPLFTLFPTFGQTIFLLVPPFGVFNQTGACGGRWRAFMLVRDMYRIN